MLTLKVWHFRAAHIRLWFMYTISSHFPSLFSCLFSRGGCRLWSYNRNPHWWDVFLVPLKSHRYETRKVWQKTRPLTTQMKHKSVHWFCLKWTKQLSPNSFYLVLFALNVTRTVKAIWLLKAAWPANLDKEIMVLCYHKALTPSCIKNEKFLYAHRSCLFYLCVNLLHLCLFNQFFFLFSL